MDEEHTISLDRRAGEDEIGEPDVGYLAYVANPRVIPMSELDDLARLSDLADDSLVTVLKDGRACLRVFSEEAYEGLMDRLEFLEGCYAFARMEKGLDGAPANDFVDELRERYRLSE